jgi:hypothetical protein
MEKRRGGGADLRAFTQARKKRFVGFPISGGGALFAQLLRYASIATAQRNTAPRPGLLMFHNVFRAW